MPKKFNEIRLVLGDQLNSQHSWFQSTDDSICYVMMEIRPESEYVRHHIQKIVGIFSAMRQFAIQLEKKGHSVRYIRITDEANRHSFAENLQDIIQESGAVTLSYLHPDEYRLTTQFEKEFTELKVEVRVFSSEHFFTEPEHFQHVLGKGKTYVMESFYRKLRKKHGVLMDRDEPASGQWNYDKSNRNKLPKTVQIPPPLTFGHCVTEVNRDIEEAGLSHFGEIDTNRFDWPISREESLDLVEYFISYLLPHFGDYQDALTTRGWSLFHSRLSFALNLKMLSPKEVVDRVEEKWRTHPERIQISQAEGFIRQILGWREFMRAIYWTKMPGYASMNFFGHNRKLPDYFWTGQTKMKCLSHSIEQSLKYAYAHHIQRLMVTGNFALLAGIHPDEVDQWYLGIYIDAFDWVEITNTRGMSQFADGGIVGTKPYVSSASYLHKMGDYCTQCSYDYKTKYGEKACPFNSLYWHFLQRNREKLATNPRMTMMYSVLDKMDGIERGKILDQADSYLENLETT
jgi:deoxyribodipyrimidine photolyase-related protein